MFLSKREDGTPVDGCYVIAEAGVNHDGSVEEAHRLIDAARDAGADAVKFQTFDPAGVVAAEASPAPYQAERGARGQRDLLAGLSLPSSAWPELAAHARDAGLDFLSTAFDSQSLEVVLSLGVRALKAPSGEIDNLPYLRLLASTGLPVMISTGLSTLAEVAAAVEATEAAPERCLFHCVTSYPAPMEICNLRAISTLAESFSLPVGWSDHTLGWTSAVAAVALGAVVLEKHLTMDRTAAGPDHAASADPEQFAGYVEAARSTARGLGTGIKEPAAEELPNLVHVRRGWHLRRDVASGHVLTEEDLVLLRPQTGLPPSQVLVGRRTMQALPRGHALAAQDLV